MFKKSLFGRRAAVRNVRRSRRLFLENLEGRRVLSTVPLLLYDDGDLVGMDASPEKVATITVDGSMVGGLSGDVMTTSDPQAMDAAMAALYGGGEGEAGTRRPPVDVNLDGAVTPQDVLIVTNAINLEGVHPFNPMNVGWTGWLDVSGNGWVEPMDVLLVVNDINTNGIRELWYSEDVFVDLEYYDLGMVAIEPGEEGVIMSFGLTAMDIDQFASNVYVFMEEGNLVKDFDYVRLDAHIGGHGWVDASYSPEWIINSGDFASFNIDGLAATLPEGEVVVFDLVGFASEDVEIGSTARAVVDWVNTQAWTGYQSRLHFVNDNSSSAVFVDVNAVIDGPARQTVSPGTEDVIIANLDFTVDGTTEIVTTDMDVLVRFDGYDGWLGNVLEGVELYNTVTGQIITGWDFWGGMDFVAYEFRDVATFNSDDAWQVRLDVTDYAPSSLRFRAELIERWDEQNPTSVGEFVRVEQATGDLFVTSSYQPRDGYFLAGRLEEPIQNLRLVADGEAISTYRMEWKILSGGQSVDRLVLRDENGVQRGVASKAWRDGEALFHAYFFGSMVVDASGISLSVSPRLITDEVGAISGEPFQVELVEVEAYGLTSGNRLAVNNGDHKADGEVFLGVSAPGPDQPLTSATGIVVLAKPVSATNVLPAGVLSPGIDREVFRGRVTVANHTNTNGGLNRFEFENPQVFVVSVADVEVQVDSFRLYNTFDTTMVVEPSRVEYLDSTEVTDDVINNRSVRVVFENVGDVLASIPAGESGDVSMKLTIDGMDADPTIPSALSVDWLLRQSTWSDEESEFEGFGLEDVRSLLTD